MKKLVIYLFFSLIIIGNVIAENTNFISFRGYLVDSQDEPLTGEYEITFKIYSSSTNGDILWSETDLINIDNGFYSIILGQNNPINIPFDGDIWFALQIENQLEMVPRYRYTPVLYSNNGTKVTGEVNRLTKTKLEIPGNAEEIQSWGPGGIEIDKGPQWELLESVIYTQDYYGIARGNVDNVLYGDSAHTMVNLGVACTTGTAGQNYYYSAVSGGESNSAGGLYSTVGGGQTNKANGNHATIGGGHKNKASDIYTTIGGGYQNTSSSDYATVGGGINNDASGMYATVAGGDNNDADGEAAAIGGGFRNIANGDCATIAGGSNNAASNERSVVCGGKYNSVSESMSTIGGGYNNACSSAWCVIAGGRDNTVKGNWSTISGGESNVVRSQYSVIPGGYADTITSNADYSFAAGCRAKVNNNGVFVWADHTDAEFASTGDDQFLIRANGGVGIGTGNPQGALDVSSTTGAFIVPRMTTVQRDALTPVNGMIIYITTTDQFNFYEAGSWVTK
ncbi:MAG: hypothetical protein GY855_16565 [candidate division Zixibacteria bacterium]|nr:hypothetical protein [candidate division Zixibacteria bacterium]